VTVAVSAAPRRLTVLNCGVGTDSTVLALMSAWNLLPRVDAAVFADTGDEPAAVYALAEALETVLAFEGIPFHRAFRTAPGLRDARYLHPARLPLDQALDRTAPAAWAARQTSLLDSC
jgi:hypothetical protein